MEGHISNKYAKFITSRPHSYSIDGLENIVQLLTMKANNIKLTEEIYKKDLILAYMNYGSYYAQSGNYTASQIFSSFLDNLINERILVQTEKVAVKKAENLNITDWSAKSFVTENSADDYKAQYNAIKSIKDLISQ